MIEVETLKPETPEGIQAAIAETPIDKFWEAKVNWWEELTDEEKEKRAVIVAVALAIKANPGAFPTEIKDQVSQDMAGMGIRLETGVVASYDGSCHDEKVVQTSQMSEEWHARPA